MTGVPEPKPTVFGLTLLTVHQLNERVRSCLEERFGFVAVAGEVGDLARPRSGHVYFTLRDPRAQLSAVMWRGTAQRLRFPLTDGMQVVIIGRVSVYSPRGTYQVIVEELVPRGLGELKRAVEELKRKLEAEGLFAPERKRPLPFLPLRIAVVTSPTGAAVHDIIRTALSRFPHLILRIVPVRVQGAEAPSEIVQALALAGRPEVADVVLLGRGGGGVDDLWAFNAEEVVRAVASCAVPVVSCVGHETDVTLSDLASDVRASTPTRAAEIAVPVLADVEDGLNAAAGRATRSLRATLLRLGAQLELLVSRPSMREPARRLHDAGQRCDELLARLEDRLAGVLRDVGNRLELSRASLESLSPLGALRRGYAVARVPGGRIIRTVRDLEPGGELELRFHDGTSRVVVKEIERAEGHGT